jgi:hypothetical protein
MEVSVDDDVARPVMSVAHNRLGEMGLALQLRPRAFPSSDTASTAAGATSSSTEMRLEPCVVATRAFTAGEVVMRSAPFATLLLPTDASSLRCSFCFTSKSELASASTPSSMLRCGGCKSVYYCGKQCQRRDWHDNRHKAECAFFKRPPSWLADLSKAALTDLLLVARILRRRYDKCGDVDWMCDNSHDIATHVTSATAAAVFCETSTSTPAGSAILTAAVAVAASSSAGRDDDDTPVNRQRLAQETIRYADVARLTSHSAAIAATDPAKASGNALIARLLTQPVRHEATLLTGVFKDDTDHAEWVSESSALHAVSVDETYPSLLPPFATLMKKSTQLPAKVASDASSSPPSRELVASVLTTVIADIESLLCRSQCNDFAVVTPSLATIAAGAYPLGALLNHACAYNCIASYESFSSSSSLPPHFQLFRAAVPIAVGDEVTHSYTDAASGRRRRRRLLLKRYHFECQCSRCAHGDDSDDDFDDVACSAEAARGGVSLAAAPRNKGFKHDGLSGVEAQKRDEQLAMAAQLHRAADETPAGKEGAERDALQTALRIRRHFLVASHRLLMQTHAALFNVNMAMGDLAQCVVHGEALALCYARVYKRPHPQAGVHALTLGSVCDALVSVVAADQQPLMLEKAVVYLKVATALLTITHGDENPLVVSCKQSLAACIDRRGH